MRLRLPTTREFVGGIGMCVLGVGLLVAFAPGVLPPQFVDAASALESAVPPWVVLVGLSMLVFGYALYRFNRSGPEPVDRLVESEADVDVPDLDGDAVSFDPDRPGRHFDHAMARTRYQLDREPNVAPFEATGVRTELRETLIAVRLERTDRRRSDATDGDNHATTESAIEAAIEDGSWTDDPVAGNFLGGASAPDVPRWRRLYAWFYPARAFERRVERVVDEIERQATASLDGSLGAEDSDQGEAGEEVAG